VSCVATTALQPSTGPAVGAQCLYLTCSSEDNSFPELSAPYNQVVLSGSPELQEVYLVKMQISLKPE